MRKLIKPALKSKYKPLSAATLSNMIDKTIDQWILLQPKISLKGTLKLMNLGLGLPKKQDQPLFNLKSPRFIITGR